MFDKNQNKAIFLPFKESAIVEAPPGHGKTFVMARRIQFLIESGFIKHPKKILGLTFTNAAAGEMLDDIKLRIIGKDIDLVKVMTFHSFGYKILRAYGNLLGLDRNFQIISELEQTKNIEKVSSQLSLPFNKEKFSEWRKDVFLRNNPSYTNEYSNVASSIYQAYLNDLGNTKIDYDNLLLKTIELFEKFPVILDTYRSVFSYILVDEFQDTNPLQFKFLSLLVFGNKSSQNKKSFVTPVFILADEAQAIYRFQAATLENIKLAKAAFNCTEIKLAINYRSNSESITNLTGAMRGENIQIPSVKTNLSISLNPHEEASLIINRINTYQANLGNIGVIAQTKLALGIVQASFDKNKIPYVFLSDFSAMSIEKKYENIFGAIKSLSNEKNFRGKLSTKIHQIYLANNQSEERDDVLQALLTLASNFDLQAKSLSFSEKALQFYNDILIQLNWGNLLRKTVKDKVFLSTIHGVKGLQFAQVHILGLNASDHIFYKECGQCNQGKNIESIRSSVDDSYKTLYVGLTRAQETLYLYSIQRDKSGYSRKVVCILSAYQNYLEIQGNAQFCGINP